MRIDYILSDHHAIQSGLALLSSQCEQFFEESGNIPLFKNLPTTYADIHKVKVRQKKTKEVNETFNAAFESRQHKLHERAVFACGINSLNEGRGGEEPYFVFPIDGFQYIYSPEIQNSNDNHRQVIEMFHDAFGTEDGTELAVDMIRFSYMHTKLQEGIQHGSEIIIYNIPYYYAARADAFDSYDDLLHLVQSV